MTRKSTIHPLSKAAGITLLLVMSCAMQSSALSAAQVQSTAADSPPATPRPAAADYRIGPDDEVTIHVSLADEMSNKPFLVSKSGELNLPKIGRIQVSGMTTSQLETELNKLLMQPPYGIRVPDATVRVVKSKSQPVSVYGRVVNQGEIQLEGHKTLIDVMAKAGGLAPDANPIIKVRRRKEMGSIP